MTTTKTTKARKEDRALTRKLESARKAADKLAEELSDLGVMARELGCHDEVLGALMYAYEAAVKTKRWTADARNESTKLI